MKNLETLFKAIDSLNSDNSEKIESVKTEIAAILNQTYNDWSLLKTKIQELENNTNAEYCTNEYGDVMTWIRFLELSTIPKNEREFFKDYLQNEYGYIYADFENETIYTLSGGDEIFINDSGRSHDRGIYQGSKMIIKADEYTNDENEVDETLRNELIEKHMESTGCYPGVYLTSYYDNSLTPVNTNEGK